MLVISIDPGISTADARVKGFTDAVGKASDYSYAGVQYWHNVPATAAQIVTAALQNQQPYYIGQVGLAQAVAELDGGKVTKRIPTGFSIITKGNADDSQKNAVYKSSC